MKKRILFVAAILLVAGAAALWVYGRPVYRHYKEIHSIAQAKLFMAQADFRDASLSARTALIINSNNLEACHIMADLSDRTRSPQILEWRRRIAELEPTLHNRLLLASACLRVQNRPYSIAAQMLEELANSAQNSAEYHSVAADLALKLGNRSEAISHFETAARLEPTNQLHQVNLAVVRLPSTDQAAAAAARATLERLSRSPEVGAVALRWLVGDCLRRHDLAGADRFSNQLLTDPRAGLSDRLDRLSILQQRKSPEFNSYLDSVQRESQTNAAGVYTVAAWMIGSGMADGAQQWLRNCPAKLRAEQPVPMALVECYFARRDWLGLDSFLVDQKWHDLDFLRFAFLSRASEQQQQDPAAEGRWRSAIREADTQLGSLATLLNLARNWKRTQAEEDLLWQIGRYFRSERWALRDLEWLYLASGDTHGLNKLFVMQAEYDPNNIAVENNLAATSLLLGLNLPHAHALAKELYQNHPEEPVIVSTYAYSLYLQNRTAEGLAALEKLKPEKLELPSVAVYYGVLLSAAGEPGRAAKYLKLAQKSQLLPEEKALVAEAAKAASSH
jgi:tetratricopeptide (TPR) repeat protein